MTRFAASIALALLALWAGASAASAMTIEQIVSPSGIHAWLVRELLPFFDTSLAIF